MNTLYRRISYLLFRLYYTTSHWFFFNALPSASRGQTHTTDTRKYIILCGVEAVNSYSVDKIKLFIELCYEFNSDIEVVLFSKIESPAHIERLRVINWDYQERARVLGKLARFLYPKGRFDEAAILKIASDGLAMVDLGDSQATSLKPTGFTANMLANMVFAKRFGLPFYFMAQSFGPFNYPTPLRFTLIPMLRRILPYATSICVRDKQSLSEITNLSPTSHVKQCSEFLLFNSRHISRPRKTVRQLVLIPDLYLLNKPNELGSLINACTAIADIFRLQETKLFLYDPTELDTIDSKKLPTDWVVDYPTTSQSYEVDDSTLYVSNKYHSALQHLLVGQPLVYWNADRAGTYLYKQFDLNFLLVDDEFSLKKAVESLSDPSNAAKLQVDIQKQLTTLRQSLPPFFSDLQAGL